MTTTSRIIWALGLAAVLGLLLTLGAAQAQASVVNDVSSGDTVATASQEASNDNDTEQVAEADAQAVHVNANVPVAVASSESNNGDVEQSNENEAEASNDNETTQVVVQDQKVGGDDGDSKKKDGHACSSRCDGKKDRANSHERYDADKRRHDCSSRCGGSGGVSQEASNDNDTEQVAEADAQAVQVNANVPVAVVSSESNNGDVEQSNENEAEASNDNETTQVVVQDQEVRDAGGRTAHDGRCESPDRRCGKDSKPAPMVPLIRPI